MLRRRHPRQGRTVSTDTTLAKTVIRSLDPHVPNEAGKLSLQLAQQVLDLAAEVERLRADLARLSHVEPGAVRPALSADLIESMKFAHKGGAEAIQRAEAAEAEIERLNEILRKSFWGGPYIELLARAKAAEKALVEMTTRRDALFQERPELAALLQRIYDSLRMADPECLGIIGRGYKTGGFKNTVDVHMRELEQVFDAWQIEIKHRAVPELRL